MIINRKSHRHFSIGMTIFYKWTSPLKGLNNNSCDPRIWIVPRIGSNWESMNSFLLWSVNFHVLIYQGVVHSKYPRHFSKKQIMWKHNVSFTKWHDQSSLKYNSKSKVPVLFLDFITNYFLHVSTYNALVSFSLVHPVDYNIALWSK